VSKATGLSRTTIYAGLAELQAPSMLSGRVPGERKRIRAPGGGRKKLIAKDAGLTVALDTLVDPVTRGDPMPPLRWTCKSTRQLAGELNRQGHQVSQRTVCDLLSHAGFSLQATRKTREGLQHDDRDAQFLYIAQTVSGFQSSGDPVISVDTKKKELIGDFKNGGREWQPQGDPEEVRTYDFIDRELGKVSPYGVYDVTANNGWVSVGIDHDTAGFAVESIRRWWREMGAPAYPEAHRLLITADCGGSNGYRVRLWRRELQKLADELNLIVHGERYFSRRMELPSAPSKGPSLTRIVQVIFSQLLRN